MNESESTDPQPADSPEDGPQKVESEDAVVVPQHELRKLLKRGDIGNTVSGLVELDPDFMGGPEASVIFVNWLNQLCGQVNKLQDDNQSLQSQVISARVKNAEQAGQIKQLKSERRLRTVMTTGGSLLVGGSLAFVSQVPILAGITGAVGILLLAVGLDAIPLSRSRT